MSLLVQMDIWMNIGKGAFGSEKYAININYFITKIFFQDNIIFLIN